MRRNGPSQRKNSLVEFDHFQYRFILAKSYGDIRNGQSESAWSGAAGIDVEHTALTVYSRLMRMAGNHHRDAGLFRDKIQCFQIM